jgi:hypothetical protein
MKSADNLFDKHRTRSPPAFRFCRFPTLVAVAAGPMARRFGSLKKAIAMA